MTSIAADEFVSRVHSIQEQMAQRRLDALMVYGDEYRKEQLRYVCNFWPIFERGACFIPKQGLPVFAGAPEGERYAREMCVWNDVRNIKEFACVSVPEEIDYPLAKFSSLAEILREVLHGGKRLGLMGRWDMPGPYRRARPRVDRRPANRGSGRNPPRAAAAKVRGGDRLPPPGRAAGLRRL